MSANGWDGETERRVAAQPLPPATVELLTKNHEAMAKVADAMAGLTEALTSSVLRQGRVHRIWMAIISVAVIMLFGATVRNGLVGSQNNQYVRQVAGCVEPDGECFERQAQVDREIAAENRRLIAEQIICYTIGRCPEGMDRDNLPDLVNLPPAPEEGPAP